MRLSRSNLVGPLFCVIACMLWRCPMAEAQPNSLATTPPMGWNSWDHFGRNVTDTDVRAAADAMVSSGMRDAGYIYVNIDDAWEGDRDAQGNIQTNSKFPDMKSLADYVHSKGLKFGIYSSPGPKTCAGYAGSYGYEQHDANTYANWGIDFLKYDLCSYKKLMKQGSDGDLDKSDALMEGAYQKMHQALLSTGRPIVYSLSTNQQGKAWEWGARVGANLWRTSADIHLWRSGGDIKDHYDRMSLLGLSQAGLAKYAAPGHWNDPDMLEVGNSGMTPDEE